MVSVLSSTAMQLGACCTRRFLAGNSSLARQSAQAFRSVRRSLAVKPTAAATAKVGDYVSVHYTGTLDNGEVFDTSRRPGRVPIDFFVGGGKVVPGFDLAVTGLAQGEGRKVRIEPKDAYGEINNDMRVEVPAKQAPAGLKKGDRVQLSNGQAAVVTTVGDTTLTLDLNHPLAGKHLNFDVELMKLVTVDQQQRVTFGAGCFWGVELAFQRVPGVLSTEVGYSQGSVKTPTYEQVCGGDTGHAEVVQVVYDEGEVTLEQLIDELWKRHDPTTLNRQGGDVGTQYRSGIYYHNPAQKEVILTAIQKAQSKFSNPIVTEVDAIKEYYPAEDYHQQYLSRGGRYGKGQDSSKGCSDPIRCYG